MLLPYWAPGPPCGLVNWRHGTYLDLEGWYSKLKQPDVKKVLPPWSSLPSLSWALSMSSTVFLVSMIGLGYWELFRYSSTNGHSRHGLYLDLVRYLVNNRQCVPTRLAQYRNRHRHKRKHKQWNTHQSCPEKIAGPEHIILKTDIVVYHGWRTPMEHSMPNFQFKYIKYI